jgi:DNA-binding NarL/FixJ family response regulator
VTAISGSAIDEAVDGTAALSQLGNQQKPIDLALLDVTTPGKPSSTVVREVARLRPDAKLLLERL